MPYWYDRDNEEPEYNPPQYRGILTKEKLENATLNPEGKYQLGWLKEDYPIKEIGTIPAGTHGLYRWPDGATNTRFVEFECPRVPGVMWPIKGVHIRITVLSANVGGSDRVDVD